MDELKQPQLKTIKEIADSGLLPETALRRMRREGRLPGVEIGTRFYVNFNELLEQLKMKGAKHE